MRKLTTLMLVCGSILTGGAAATPQGARQPTASRPNIILIMADDQGYETIGANGGTSYKTPHIDRLAANGMRFTNAYAHPLCTPSRVALMTGQYNFRNYTSFGELRLSEKTFGNMLRDRGYKTAIVGKWQLSERDFQAPFHFGFEEYLLWHFGTRINGVQVPGSQGSRYWDPVFYHNGQLLPDTKGKFGPDVMADFVADYIHTHRDEPFFLYYPLVLPHDPWIEPPGYTPAGGFSAELRAYYGPRGNTVEPKETEERQRRFGAMIEYMDTLVGRVTGQLDALKLSENTLVLFTSDNGSYAALRSTLNGREMNGDKGRPTDAGTHVPLIAQWKRRIPAGKVNHDLIDFTDFLPTLAEIAGARVPAGVTVDGRSFAPQLRGQRGTPRDWIFCHYDPRWANFASARYAQDQQYKLYDAGGLYDYRQDPLEQRPLARTSLTPAQERSRQNLQRVLDRLK
jgi:arylsulfatase A-like enzyme